MFEKYLKYNLDDWVTDTDFIAYVKGSNPAFEEIIFAMTSERTKSMIAQAKQMILGIQEVSEGPQSGSLDQIFDKINETLDKKHEAKRGFNIRRLAWPIGIAASILLLLVFLPAFIPTNHMTAIGQNDTIELPDNSLVVINAASKISYNKRRWNNNRKIKLEGEAFFKVEKGSTFTVETDKGSVTVLGTQFNVYNRDGSFEVECTEGRVRVDLADGRDFELRAGDRLSDIKDQTPILEKQAVKKVDWLNNYVDFSNRNLDEVLKELSIYYKVKIKTDVDLKEIKYNGFFTTRSLDSALYQVFFPLDLDYKLENNEVIIEEKK